MITRTLTGKTRFREEKRWFKPSLLILQVEEHLTGHTAAFHDDSSIPVDELKYRDLSICDLPSPAALASWVNKSK